MTKLPDTIWATGNDATGSWNADEGRMKMHMPDGWQVRYTLTDTIPALLAAEREKVLREVATELEVNWGHKATPEIRDAILAMIDTETKPTPPI